MAFFDSVNSPSPRFRQLLRTTRSLRFLCVTGTQSFFCCLHRFGYACADSCPVVFMHLFPSCPLAVFDSLVLDHFLPWTPLEPPPSLCPATFACICGFAVAIIFCVEAVVATRVPLMLGIIVGATRDSCVASVPNGYRSWPRVGAHPPRVPFPLRHSETKFPAGVRRSVSQCRLV